MWGYISLQVDKGHKAEILEIVPHYPPEASTYTMYLACLQGISLPEDAFIELCLGDHHFDTVCWVVIWLLATFLD